MLNRRNFITSAVAGMLATSIAPGWALGQLLASGESDSGEPLPNLEKEQLNTERNLQPPRYIEGVLQLKSGHTGEKYRFPFRDSAGNYDQQMLLALSWFMRCHYDQQYITMDIRVIELLNYISMLLNRPMITVTSGYRTPSYNALIARSNENVAKNSLHMRGMAVDFCIPGIPIRTVCQYAQLARNIAGAGGVGYYPSQGFVHIDSGTRHATWVR